MPINCGSATPWRDPPKPAPVAAPQPALPEIETVLMPHEPPPLEKRIENVILRALKAAGLLKKK